MYIRNKFDEMFGTIKGTNIEKSIYNYTINFANEKGVDCDWNDRIFSHIYKQHYCTIVGTLQSDDALREKIVSGELKAQSAATVILARSEESNEQAEEVADGIFQCAKCGSRKTTHYSMQTRSADEPMTNFITCVACKHRWKM